LVTVEASHGIKLIAADPNAEHAEEEAGHENGNAHNDEHNHDGNTDPHTWVSPRSAIQMAENIKNALIQVDEAHQADYEANYTVYVSKLTVLDKKFTTELSAAPKKDIVVSHQAFAYLCRDYGLNQVAIMGLTPEAEPRGQDLLNITKFVKEHQVKYIFFEELVSDKLAKTLANEAGIDTLVLNPLEGLTEEAIAAGEDFISTMENNLQNLLKALQ
jgi:zinc transport system substrate-binding protein